ncbi:MAG: ornithine cyclodeaminase family protein [Actinomycetota bacterium]|nr:ornithine cyclodeaminase family protein [Actinomycetota bacterium]
MTEVRFLREQAIRGLINPAQALERTRAAFAALARGEVVLPEVMFFDLKSRNGEVHAKGAYIEGSPFFSLKVASGFYDNANLGLPVTAGVVLVFNAETGQLDTILFDNGYLTELRTGAAGALAADLLARTQIEQVGIYGTGSQARYQLEALVGVRTPSRIVVWGRSPERARAYADEMQDRIGVPIEVAIDPQQAARGSGIIVTATSAQSPILLDSWVEPGTHVTAMGSDVPDKHEVDVNLLRRATVIADSLRQCLTQGEIHQAVKAGAMVETDVYELGEIAAGMKPGRTSENEITLVDLTGVGVLDAAVASHVVSMANESNLGETIET